jgi:ribosomal protein S18 acetylase RimI-like enzyme
MSEALAHPDFNAIPLTHDMAEQYISELTALANQIPEVEYLPEDILAEQKGERQMLNKWQHSLVILDNDKPVAFVMGYERQAEGNEQYPRDTLYVSELAVAEEYQRRGMARSLLRQFLEKNNALGFQSLKGEVNYSLQTNSAEWNIHVIELYKSFGFKQRATKQYPNRTDVILGADLNGLQIQ